MIRGSITVAVLAVILSVLAHLFGLTMTASPRLDRTAANPSPDAIELGNTFEEVADITPDPVEPEAAEVPEPPAETAPEPEAAEIPVSEALVASDNPQNVPAPDLGDNEVVQPITSEAEAVQAVEPSEGDAEASDDASVTPAVEPQDVTEIPQGTEVETTQSVEATEETQVAEPSQQIAALPVETPSPDAAIPIVPLEQEAVEPEATETPPVPDQVEPTETGPAVTASLRPRLPDQRPDPDQSGAENGSDEFANLRFPTQVIESPLTQYQREGVDSFTSGNSGNRSGGRGPGNSDTTNYAGRVLVHLNRAPVVFVPVRGFARVFFQIDPDGSLAWVDVIDSSGSPEVDRAAKAQVRAAAPFPRPPGGVSRKLSFYYQNS